MDSVLLSSRVRPQRSMKVPQIERSHAEEQ